MSKNVGSHRFLPFGSWWCYRCSSPHWQSRGTRLCRAAGCARGSPASNPRRQQHGRRAGSGAESPDEFPSARYGHAMAYDSARG